MKRKKPESVKQTENMTTIVTGKLVLERNKFNEEALRKEGKTVIEQNGTSVQTLVFFGPPGGAVPRAKLANGKKVAADAASAGGASRPSPPASMASGPGARKNKTNKLPRTLISSLQI